MSKIDTLSDITASFGSTTKVNSNFDKIETALQNTISRDGSSPNEMLADLDMNSNQFLNLGTPVLDFHAATKAYVDDLIEDTQSLITGGGTTSLAFALERANHTGVQAISTVTGLQAALDLKANESSLPLYLRITDAVASYQPLSGVLTNTTASFLVADEAKLDGIEALADVTDAANVNAAGAIMHTDISPSGVLVKTAAESYTARTITGTSAEITVTNGDGASGNPTLSLPTNMTLTGKTLTNGTFVTPTLSGAVAGNPTFSGGVTFSNATGITLASTIPRIIFNETDAGVDEKLWWLNISAGDFSISTRTDANTTGATALIVQRTGTVIDEVQVDATNIDINGAMDVSGNLTSGGVYSLGGWSVSNTDIDGLISGSTVGTLLQSYTQGHITIGIRDNDGGDGFQVLSGYDGVNFYTTDSLYKRLCFEVKATGNAYINGTLDLGHASANTLSASGGVLSIEGVAIPTISSSSTLTNKTLSSPTVSGTVAGTPTISGVWTFSSSPVVPTPAAATDAANKAYVDSVATGLQVKDSAVLATTANITLSGEQTIDGTLTSTSRVLVKNQTLSENNGIYVSAAGSWARATDMNTWTETVGALVSVTGGATNANKVFASTTASGGTLGTTSVTFAEFINTSGLQPLNSGLTAISTLATVAYGRGVLELASAGALQTYAGLVIGTNVQAYSSVLANTTASFTTADETKLDGIEAAADVTDATNVNAAGALMHTDLATNGMLVRTGSEAYAARTITGPAAGLTVSDGDGVAGNPTLALANDLAAVEGISGTGFAVRYATDLWVQRSVFGTANEITVTNGDGVAGSPVLSLPAAMTFTGKTVTGGTFAAPTLSGTIPGTPTFSGNVVFSGAPNFTGVPTFGSMSASAIALSGAIDIGHASDTTLSRKSAGVLQVESRQLATVGAKLFRTSQYLVQDGTTDDAAAVATLVTTVNSAGGVMVVDGLIRLSSNTTISCPLVIEAGGFTVDSGDVLTITGALAAPRIQIFQGVGTVTWNAANSEIMPEWWGVLNTGSSATNLSSVNAMHASVTAGDRGAVVTWATKAYTFSGAWTAITKNNIRHVGAGGSSLGTWFIFENTTGDDITFSNCQHCGVENISFIYYAKKTSGYAIKFDLMSWSFIRNCAVYYGYNGFNVCRSTETVVHDCMYRNLAGTRGLLYNGTGTGTNSSYRIHIRNLLGATAAPIGSINDITKIKGNWATSTAYALEDIVLANSRFWMCTTAGTSSGAGSGPSSLPGSTAPEQWSTEVSDGTAGWKFLWSSDLTWLCQDSYGYSLALDGAALVNGAWGFQMTDTVNSGSSYPIWAYLRGIEVDHNHWAGINLDRGEGAYIFNGWMGSVLSGHGIRSTANFRGEVTVIGNRIYANTNSGIYIACPGWVVTGNQIGDNSVVSSGAHNGVTVAANVSDFLITSNRIGDLVGVAGNRQGYGVKIDVGTSDNYIVTQNIMRNNTTGGLSDGGTGVNKTVTGNIV